MRSLHHRCLIPKRGTVCIMVHIRAKYFCLLYINRCIVLTVCCTLCPSPSCVGVNHNSGPIIFTLTNHTNISKDCQHVWLCTAVGSYVLILFVHGWSNQQCGLFLSWSPHPLPEASLLLSYCQSNQTDVSMLTVSRGQSSG